MAVIFYISGCSNVISYDIFTRLLTDFDCKSLTEHLPSVSAFVFNILMCFSCVNYNIRSPSLIFSVLLPYLNMVF